VRVDPVTIGAVLLAIISGAGEGLGGKLWEGVTALIRRPFRGRVATSGGGTGTVVVPAGNAELAAFQQAPGDQQKAVALAEALLARAGADPKFRQALEGWWIQAEPIRAGIGNVTNTISGGAQQGPVLQGRDFSDITFGAPPPASPPLDQGAGMADDGGGGTHSGIGGGIQLGPVLQGRDFRVTFVTNQATAAPVALAQLPTPVVGFTGRGEELAQITALLDPAGGAGTVVVSAVAGLAGVGKSALAIQAGHAARAAGWFAGGVLFIDLHGYDDAPVEPGQALDALLRALGVPSEHVPPGAEERSGLWRSVLAQISEPLLIIADNASSEMQVRPLLPGIGPHRVMVTSRHTLAGLGARLLDVTALDDPTGVALLAEALRAARPGDNRISGDRGAAGRLAGICGGLPLALWITAALLAADPALTVEELGDELADEVHRLAALRYDDGSGTSAPSVAAAFELSYRQLDRATARMFRLLPASPGPDLSTAAAAALADRPVSQTRKVIGQLVRAHLVEAAAGAAGRWRMHDLLRLYARQLSESHADADGRAQAQDRLLDYYLDSAYSASDHLKALPGERLSAQFADRSEALAWLDAERPSLVAACTMAASTGRDRVALALPFMLGQYLSERRRFDDWLTVMVISRDVARRLGNRVDEASALTALGIALVELRRFDEAITANQEAAVISREAGDRQIEGDALNHLGVALRELRRFEEAITAHQEAAAMFREAGDRYREGGTLNNLGLALYEVQRFEEAVTAHQEAAAMFREADYRYREGLALDNLGIALLQVRRFEEAITAHQEAAAIFREAGDRHGEGMALTNLGVVLYEVRRFEEAITFHQEAAAIFREADDRYRRGNALNNLGVALRAMRRFDEAITAHQDAVAIYREAGDPHNEGIALYNLELDQAAQRT
jgi:tetratricopeptide (TPR) repeat protein